jgi:hypothetical protein
MNWNINELESASLSLILYITNEEVWGLESSVYVSVYIPLDLRTMEQPR